MIQQSWLLLLAFSPSPFFRFSCLFFSFAGHLVGFISVGKVFGKAFRISELDERKDSWVVEQDFQANFRGNVTWFSAFFSLTSLTEPCSFWYIWFENSPYPAKVRGQNCPWTLKLTTSQAGEVTWIYMKQFRAVRGRIDWCADKKRRNNFLAWMTVNG